MLLTASDNVVNKKIQKGKHTTEKKHKHHFHANEDHKKHKKHKGHTYILENRIQGNNF